MQVARASGAAGGVLGARFDGLKRAGGTLERAVESDAVQVAEVVEVPAVEVQLTGFPWVWVPFMNWTAPVTPGPFFVELVMVALRVTMLPEVTVVALAVIAAVVGTVPVVVTATVVLPVLEA